MRPDWFVARAIVLRQHLRLVALLAMTPFGSSFDRPEGKHVQIDPVGHLLAVVHLILVVDQIHALTVYPRSAMMPAASLYAMLSVDKWQLAQRIASGVVRQSRAAGDICGTDVRYIETERKLWFKWMSSTLGKQWCDPGVLGG